MQRAFRFVLSIWFLLVLVDPEAVHACPLHTPSTTATVDHSAHGAANHDAQEGHSSSAKCSCPDDCATVSVVLQISVAERDVAAAIVEAEPVQPRTGVATLALPPPFFLPFANGPPSLPG